MAVAVLAKKLKLPGK